MKKLTHLKNTRLDLILNEKQVADILSGNIDKDIKKTMQGFLIELKELKSILKLTTGKDAITGKLEWRDISIIRNKFVHNCKFLSESFVNNTFNIWDS